MTPSRSGLYTVDEIYALLPQLHRLADAERGEPLRALLEVGWSLTHEYRPSEVNHRALRLQAHFGSRCAGD